MPGTKRSIAAWIVLVRHAERAVLATTVRPRGITIVPGDVERERARTGPGELEERPVELAKAPVGGQPEHHQDHGDDERWPQPQRGRSSLRAFVHSAWHCTARAERKCRESRCSAPMSSSW